MTVLFSDAFGGTSGDSLSTYSASWAKRSGSDIFVSDVGRARMGVSGSSALWYRTDTISSADYSVAADIVRVSAAAGNAIGVVGRCSTSADTCYNWLWTDNIGWRMYKIVAGAFTQLGSTTAHTFTQNVLYNEVLEMVGTAIKGYRELSGTPIVSVTDSSISAAGKAGIRGFGATSQSDTVGVHLDNFVVDDLASGGTTTTLDVTGATLTLTGGTVGLNRIRNLSVTGGSLTFTGATVNLKVARVMTVLPTTLTLTGGTVELGAVGGLDVTGGALTLTGGTVGLNLTKSVNVTGGALNLTGGTVNLKRAYVLGVTGGTLTLTGATVTLTHTTAGGGGVTVTFLQGLSTAALGGSGVSQKNRSFADAGGGTYTVTEESTLSQDKRDSLNLEDYIIG